MFGKTQLLHTELNRRKSMRLARLLLTGALVLGGLVQPARAQEEKDEECRCPTPWTTLRVLAPEGGLRTLTWIGGRARLGVLVNIEANPETDRYGALIDGVTEGGPADKAGLKEGDIITELDGESLLSGGEAFDEDQSAPGMRLIERARKLEREDTVKVEYRRDGKTKTTELVVGDFDDWTLAAAYSGDSDRMRRLLERVYVPQVHVTAPESFALRVGATLPGLELVLLNRGLGEYFGTDEGVLVVSIPEESELSLKAGDVIQTIGGRKVKSPSHAMRILRSYEGDEEVTFEILRKKKKMTVSGKASRPFDAESVFRLERHN
jgi:membrane-associated protease RseP (regulator of RpoE activity)